LNTMPLRCSCGPLNAYVCLLMFGCVPVCFMMMQASRLRCASSRASSSPPPGSRGGHRCVCACVRGGRLGLCVSVAASAYTNSHNALKPRVKSSAHQPLTTSVPPCRPVCTCVCVCITSGDPQRGERRDPLLHQRLRRLGAAAEPLRQRCVCGCTCEHQCSLPPGPSVTQPSCSYTY
jgi:hypothetical protein